MVLIRHSDNQIVIICDSHHKQYKMQTKKHYDLQQLYNLQQVYLLVSLLSIVRLDYTLTKSIGGGAET